MVEPACAGEPFSSRSSRNRDSEGRRRDLFAGRNAGADSPPLTEFLKEDDRVVERMLIPLEPGAEQGSSSKDHQ